MTPLVDLFCDIGGFSEGARQADCEVVLAIDSYPLALATHHRNHPRRRHLQLDLPKAGPATPDRGMSPTRVAHVSKGVNGEPTGEQRTARSNRRLAGMVLRHH